VWLDAGTFSSLQQASNYVETIQERSGIMIGCIEEAAVRKGFITYGEGLELAYNMKNSYGDYLRRVCEKVALNGL
jgi:glucose-1-phosphate thymidylyltransferase